MKKSKGGRLYPSPPWCHEKRDHRSRLSLETPIFVASRVKSSSIIYQRQSSIDKEHMSNNDTRPQGLLWGGNSQFAC